MVRWSFPFKPVRAPDRVFETMDLTGYVMERKFDGWRAIVVSDEGTVSLWTRDKVRIEVPENLSAQLAELNLPHGTVLDGEIWNPMKRGSWRHNRSVRCKLTLWDVMTMGTLEERKEALSKLVRATEDIELVKTAEASRSNFEAVLQETRDFRIENEIRSGFVHGVVLKRRGSPRRDHATRCVEHPDWMKIVFPEMSGWAPRS